jgi:type I restriction enzyme S subunit
MDVLLSIKPKYAEAILSGDKRYEFRRTLFKRRDIRRVYLYANNHVGKIVGSFEIAETLKGTPETIWEKCHHCGGVTRGDFFKYFKGSQQAFAYKIRNVQRFPGGIDLQLVKGFSRKTPPQSFCYLLEDTQQLFV